jgi:hypothetical protein
MLGSLRQSTGRLDRRAAPMPHFGGGMVERLTQHEAKIANLKAGNRLQNILNSKWGKSVFNRDVRIFNMSLEDVAGRLQTILGVYLLQGIFAVKDQKHPWETNGRNFVVWVLGTALTIFSKDRTWGVNNWLDKLFMRPRRAIPKEASAIRRRYTHALNALRMPLDYRDILKNAGIEDARQGAWACMDANKLHRLKRYYTKLQAKPPGALDKAEKEILDHMPAFLRRLNLFPLVSTGIITAGTIYIVGGLAMDIVYKFIAPFDKDFDPSKLKNAKKSSATPAPAANPTPTPPKQTTLMQPQAFTAFSARPPAVVPPTRGLG